MDPKEYIPDLEAFTKLPEEMKRFRIDERLERKEKALHHIATSHFEVFCDYVARWNMYPLAIELVEQGSDSFKTVCGMYAEYLYAENNFNMAGDMYHLAESYKLSLDCFTEAGNWKKALFTCRTHIPDAFEDTCAKLVVLLQSVGKWDEIASVQFEAGQNEAGVISLTKAGKWTLALSHSPKFGIVTEVVTEAMRTCKFT
jgi:IKI3 family